MSPRAPVDPMGLADPVVRGSWIAEKHMKAFSFSDPRGGTVDVLLVSPVDHQAALRAGHLRSSREGEACVDTNID
jgi:hypothetical protein